MLEHQIKYQKALRIQREIAESLNKETNLKDIMQSSLDRLLKMMNLSTGWIFLTDNRTSYEMIADHKLPPALEENRESLMTCQKGASDCKCLSLYFEGELSAAVNHVKCARLNKAISLSLGDTKGLSHHASIPLIVKEKKLGLLNLASHGKKHFDEDELILLETVAYQIGIAIERYKLQEEKRLLILEKERNRLARDLHDSVKQKLFALSLTSRGLGNIVPEEEERVHELTQDIMDLTKDALTDMHRLIWELRPLDLEEDLAAAFYKYAEKIGIDLTVSSMPDFDLISVDKEAVWRIGQEALNNVKKHAGTDEAKIDITVTSQQLKMLVIDKGAGGAKDSKYNMGLKNIKERTEELQGNFYLESGVGDGTTLTILIPI